MTAEAARDFLNRAAAKRAARDGSTPRTYTLAEARLAVQTGERLLTIVRTTNSTAPVYDAPQDPPRRARVRPAAGDRRPE